MRLLAALALCVSTISAQAQTLDVSVIHGVNEPVKYTFPLTEHREQIDLRESHNYHAAFTDPSTKKDICREGVYQTGLLLTLRPIDKPVDGEVSVEIIGQISSLSDLKEENKLSCGTNFKPILANAPFSDTVRVSANKKKVVVIDNTYTVIVTLR
jgi:hypothetical protein